MRVWTDWMDYLPVVGTVKNTVEAVTALCKGDYDQAKQKGASAAIGLLLDVTTGGAAHAAGTVATRVSENLAIKGVSKLVALKVAKQARTEAAIATKLTLEDLIKRSKERDPETKEDEKKKPAQRGEHVINNNVLRVFRTIIDRFAARLGQPAVQLLRPNTRAYEAYYSPLPESTARTIGYEMVAHIPENEPYVDANSSLYGLAIEQISNMVVQYMYDFHHNNSFNASAVDRNIITLVNLLNGNQLYVDEYAKLYWLQQGGNEALFEECRGQVAQMFRRLCASPGGENEAKQWVYDLRPATGLVMMVE